jgi:hypothetical protein
MCKQCCDAKFEHIEGHDNNEWNELADVAAKARAKEVIGGNSTAGDPTASIPGIWASPRVELVVAGTTRRRQKEMAEDSLRQVVGQAP